MGLPANLPGLCRQVDEAMTLLSPGGLSVHEIPFGLDRATYKEFRSWCKTRGYKIHRVTSRPGHTTVVMAKSTKSK